MLTPSPTCRPSRRATHIETARLTLRPFRLSDAARVVEIQSDWQVMRMLREASFPATLASTRAWLASHAAEWEAATAFRFAAWKTDRLIGCADLDEIAAGAGHLGYWFERAAWGQGFATEAGTALLDFGRERLGLTRFLSGCAADNPASARVLEKLGFRETGRSGVWSKPRASPITQIHWERAA